MNFVTKQLLIDLGIDKPYSLIVKLLNDCGFESELTLDFNIIAFQTTATNADIIRICK